jgi:hypothetical protein
METPLSTPSRAQINRRAADMQRVRLAGALAAGSDRGKHLTYSERFCVREGRLTVEVDGARQQLAPGRRAASARHRR